MNCCIEDLQRRWTWRRWADCVHPSARAPGCGLDGDGMGNFIESLFPLSLPGEGYFGSSFLVIEASPSRSELPQRFTGNRYRRLGLEIKFNDTEMTRLDRWVQPDSSRGCREPVVERIWTNTLHYRRDQSYFVQQRTRLIQSTHDGGDACNSREEKKFNQLITSFDPFSLSSLSRWRRIQPAEFKKSGDGSDGEIHPHQVGSRSAKCPALSTAPPAILAKHVIQFVHWEAATATPLKLQCAKAEIVNLSPPSVRCRHFFFFFCDTPCCRCDETERKTSP